MLSVAKSPADVIEVLSPDPSFDYPHYRQGISELAKKSISRLATFAFSEGDLKVLEKLTEDKEFVSHLRLAMAAYASSGDCKSSFGKIASKKT